MEKPSPFALIPAQTVSGPRLAVSCLPLAVCGLRLALPRLVKKLVQSERPVGIHPACSKDPVVHRGAMRSRFRSLPHSTSQPSRGRPG